VFLLTPILGAGQTFLSPPLERQGWVGLSAAEDWREYGDSKTYQNADSFALYSSTQLLIVALTTQGKQHGRMNNE